MPNVIAPNMKTENSPAIISAIGKWKYTSSVSTVAPKVMKWKGLTCEIARELYLAREALNAQDGQRKDPDAPDYIEHTWNDYCEEVGISKRTANGWLRCFVPAELSESGEDLLLDAPPPDPDSERIEDARTAREARIAMYRSTGIRPEGWTDDDEIELRKRLTNERISRLANEFSGRKIGSIRPKKDYLSEVAANTKNIRRFKLSPDQQVLDADVQSAVQSYFLTFDNTTTRLKVAYNLMESVKEIVNELTEYDLKQSQANEEGEE